MTRGMCMRCGAPKEQAGKGIKLCDACRTSLLPNAELTAKRRAERERALQAPAGKKWCARCDNDLPLAQFGTRAKSDKPTAYCIPCQKSYLHENRIKKLYNIDLAEYNHLLETQGGRCAICRSKPRTTLLAVDHDHLTGEVRGLLCSRCNHKMLGSARERSDILRRAANYLDAPPARMGTTDHLGPDEQFVEALAQLEEARKEAPSELAAVVYAVEDESLSVGDWPVLVTLKQFTELIRSAGYGDVA